MKTEAFAFARRQQSAQIHKTRSSRLLRRHALVSGEERAAMPVQFGMRQVAQHFDISTRDLPKGIIESIGKLLVRLSKQGWNPFPPARPCPSPQQHEVG